jgi:threonine aldolase
MALRKMLEWGYGLRCCATGMHLSASCEVADIFMFSASTTRLGAAGALVLHSGNMLWQACHKPAAEACQARGYRLLAAGVRAVMQRQPQWRARLRQRVQLPGVLRQQRRQGDDVQRLEPAAAADAGGQIQAGQ